MLRPSYTELMNLLNKSEKLDNKITSRYTIVMAVAKRARQIIAGSESLAECKVDKAVSVAVAELAEGKLFVTTLDAGEAGENRNEDSYVPEEAYEDTAADSSYSEE
ncbi:DNA-directed RNA polymerase subunit omega [Anaeropeptidivorans aminofermentans]|uniref:DNA-directed RNA polymerase subunit omega n=1 Tax=Anaeropeptidivorans aminofermentans TaxID=2934315 RepID=UPI0020250BF7|nr:DNA-directed RNA polymerase subunit omega [Anaeropeptidivorans aminofermentans]